MSSTSSAPPSKALQLTAAAVNDHDGFSVWVSERGGPARRLLRSPESIELGGSNAMVRGGTEVAADRLESSIGSALARAMHADQGLEEGAVGEGLGFLALFPDGQSLLERGSELRFVLRLDPDEHQVHVLRLKRLLRRLHHRVLANRCKSGLAHRRR